MKPGYTIRQRGLTEFNKIYVFNWYPDMVDIIQWDYLSTPYFPSKDVCAVVAVFNIKWKNK